MAAEEEVGREKKVEEERRRDGVWISRRKHEKRKENEKEKGRPTSQYTVRGGGTHRTTRS